MASIRNGALMGNLGLVQVEATYINEHIAAHNAKPKPFIWETAKVTRARAALSKNTSKRIYGMGGIACYGRG